MKLSNIVLLSLLLVFINACSRIQDSIVGSWKDPEKRNSCMVFNKDGTFTSSGGGLTVSGSYTFTNGNQMTMKFEQSMFGVEAVATQVSIEGNTLVVSDQKSSQNIMKLERAQCQ